MCIYIYIKPFKVIAIIGVQTTFFDVFLFLSLEICFIS